MKTNSSPIYRLLRLPPPDLAIIPSVIGAVLYMTMAFLRASRAAAVGLRDAWHFFRAVQHKSAGKKQIKTFDRSAAWWGGGDRNLNRALLCAWPSIKFDVDDVQHDFLVTYQFDTTSSWHDS